MARIARDEVMTPARSGSGNGILAAIRALAIGRVTGGKKSEYSAPTTYQVGPGFKGKNPNYTAPSSHSDGGPWRN